MNADKICVHLRNLRLVFYLETELQSKLNLSRIACCEELSELTDVRQILDAVKGRVCRRPIGNRLKHVVEDRLVEDIVELAANLEVHPFREVEALIDVPVELLLTVDTQHIPSQVSVVAQERLGESQTLRVGADGDPIHY